MRNLLPLLIVLLVAGCEKPMKLMPVAVDEAAAYPSQKPGTRPPVLTGFDPLTKEELDFGEIRIFDGISTYGWDVEKGKATLAVKKYGDQNLLTWDQADRDEIVISNRFSDAKIISVGDKMTCVGTIIFYITFYGPGWNAHDGSREMQNVVKGIAGARGDPANRQTLEKAAREPLDRLLEADWKPVAGESKAAWTNGELELTGGLGMVETVKEYGDFVLQLEYYTEPNVNSGVFFRCIPGETLNGYECQVFNNPPAEDYDKFIGTDTGGIFRRCVGRNVGPKDGEWNYLTIAVRGPMIATWVNGIQTVDWTDTRKEDENPRKGLRLKPGTIQLQGHDPGTKIKFRNFRIAEME